MFKLRITDNLEVEIWRNVVDYHNNIIDGYLISNKGTLRSVDRVRRGKNGSSVPVSGRILIPYTKRGKSYKRATLCINGKIYSSRFEAAKELNVHPDSVWCCCSGRHKKTRNGYSFKFA